MAREGSMADRMRRVLAAGYSETALVYDGLSAKLAEASDFKSLYLAGSAVSASLGFPDVGLVTFSETLDAVGKVTRSVDIPLLCDADTGYGNVVNVQRTVREFERAGAAGLHLEDQQFPKKSAMFEVGALVPIHEHCQKIRAACEAHVDPNFVIIGRTDALPVEGWRGVVERAVAYREAGADLIMVPALPADEIKPYSDHLVSLGLPCILATAAKVAPEEAVSLGFVLKLNGAALQGAYEGMFRSLLRVHRGSAADSVALPPISEILGLGKIADLEARYR